MLRSDEEVTERTLALGLDRGKDASPGPRSRSSTGASAATRAFAKAAANLAERLGS